MLINRVHIGKAILERLREKQMSVATLAGLLFTNESNMYKILKRESINTDMLVRVSEILDYNFFSLYTTCVKQHSYVILVQTNSEVPDFANLPGQATIIGQI